MKIEKKYLGWMMILGLLNLTGCGLLEEKKIVGSFCDNYTVVDIPTSEAKKLLPIYQERILANERLQHDGC